MAKRKRRGPAPIGLGPSFQIRLLKKQDRKVRELARAKDISLADAVRQLIGDV